MSYSLHLEVFMDCSTVMYLLMLKHKGEDDLSRTNKLPKGVEIYIQKCHSVTIAPHVVILSLSMGRDL